MLVTSLSLSLFDKVLHSTNILSNPETRKRIHDVGNPDLWNSVSSVLAHFVLAKDYRTSIMMAIPDLSRARKGTTFGDRLTVPMPATNNELLTR